MTTTIVLFVAGGFALAILALIGVVVYAIVRSARKNNVG